AATSIDAHRCIALGHPPLRIDGFPVHPRVRFFLEIARRNPQLVLLIRPQIQDGGKRASSIPPKHIGFEIRSVAHGHLDVRFEENVERAWRRLHLHRCCFPAAPGRQSGRSIFTSSVTFFQYASSALFHACASSIEALGKALIICCLKAVSTCSEPS